ncbi:purine nucleoside phosphorylase [Caballeronia arationis]|uniref:DUF4148 domain-containing protein n=1 Tax=Caballeronia arationis TaxID=1777142 RepID=UPI00074CD2CF|nr:DUF4148 domain-containing protein [Caballeronia arationis]SAL05601.1 purine nucleoside phosphorylase [Caballeronia arationis]
MKLATIIIAAALAIPAASSFAQSQPTRAQVKAELVQLRDAGYNPSMDRTTYPAQIEAAEAKVAAQSGPNSYGGVADTASASGGPARTGNSIAPVYFGH